MKCKVCAILMLSLTCCLKLSAPKYNLLGPDPSLAMVKFFSNEEQVRPQTPPTYLTHCGDDALVKVDNSILFYQALIRNKVPAEMRLYPKGNHNFVLRLPPDDWLNPILSWIKKGAWLN